MLKRLNTKVCIVTGAASGIGWQTAIQFLDEGAVVHAIDIDSSGLEKLHSEFPSINIHQVDVCCVHQIEKLVDGLDNINVLFNCAGRVDVGNIVNCTDQQWLDSVELNISSIFRLTRAVLPKMLASGGGSIINMASVISSIGGAPDRFAYGATKGAVIGITKSIAKDFSAQGIRCNAICPSAVETPTMTERIDAMPDPQDARNKFNERQLVGRMGSPREIASLAIYLASDESKFTTGSAIVIDGGAKV